MKKMVRKYSGWPLIGFAFFASMLLVWPVLIVLVLIGIPVNTPSLFVLRMVALGTMAGCVAALYTKNHPRQTA